MDALKSLYNSAQQLFQSSEVTGNKLSLLGCHPSQGLLSTRDVPSHQPYSLPISQSGQSPFAQASSKFLASNIAAMAAAAAAVNPSLFPIMPFPLLAHQSRSPHSLSMHQLAALGATDTSGIQRQFALAASLPGLNQGPGLPVRLSKHNLL